MCFASSREASPRAKNSLRKRRRSIPSRTESSTKLDRLSPSSRTLSAARRNSGSTRNHVILCFVLEHLPDPDRALRRLVRAVRPGGTVTAIEGDHGSTFFHPDDPFARRAIEALVELQRRGGGHALIGRELYPRFVAAGLSNVCVSPRFVYADASRPAMVEGFTRLTFAAMVEGVTDDALRAGLMSREDWERGIRALYRCAEPDGVFCYTFFKAAGTR